MANRVRQVTQTLSAQLRSDSSADESGSIIADLSAPEEGAGLNDRWFDVSQTGLKDSIGEGSNHSDLC